MPRVPEDLASHNCLAFNLQGGQQRGWTFSRDGKPFAVRVDGDLDCNDGELLYDWVKMGLGIGWRSTWEIQAELKRGELVTVLDDYAMANYDIQAVYPQQRYLPAKVRHFIDYLRTFTTSPAIGSVARLEPAAAPREGASWHSVGRSKATRPISGISSRAGCASEVILGVAASRRRCRRPVCHGCRTCCATARSPPGEEDVLLAAHHLPDVDHQRGAHQGFLFGVDIEVILALAVVVEGSPGT